MPKYAMRSTLLSAKYVSPVTPMSKQSTVKSLLLFLTVLLCSSSLVACWKTCPVCPPSPITLQTVPAPTLRPIDATARNGEYCLSDTDRRSLLVDIELLRAWGAGNGAVIEEWNKQIGVK